MIDAYQSAHIVTIEKSMSEITTRRGGGGGGGESPVVVRTDLSTLLSDYTNSQRRYNHRLASLEREMASLKGQVNQVVVPSDEHELNRTFTTKKLPVPQPTSARAMSPSRIPLPVTPRKSAADDKSTLPTNDIRSPLAVPLMTRSKTFHNNTSQSSSSEEVNLLRAYKAHLEQTFQKESRIPSYNTIEDVIKANEQLLLENDRLRSELNRVKTESILLIRSMKSTATAEPNSGNERITAERERQELTTELARQVEENKRLRKSLLAQSTKFLTLRQSTNISDASLSTSIDHRLTPASAPQSSPNSTRLPKAKSARMHTTKQGFIRTKSFHNETTTNPT